MSTPPNPAKITWRDGTTPIADAFDDPYFSLQDGPAETGHVFLEGNDLPDRFQPGFHIAELGFGTGLNLLCAWAAWEAAGQTSPLQFTSFEAFPMRAEDMAKAQYAWPHLAPYAARFTAFDHPAGRLKTDTLDLHVIYGDARQTLPTWQGRADAWFLDGFSPAKNPELWQPDLMDQVATHTTPNGTCATYSAAGHVRQGLAEAGFQVTKAQGFGRKRHMTRGRLVSE